MNRKQRRLRLVLIGMLGLAAAAVLVLSALEDKVTFFYSPSEIPSQLTETGRTFRLGGLVAEGSLQTDENDAATVYFDITDNNTVITVTYTGILPDLFREGQGVIAEGYIREDGIFAASTILAKHDETYMPPDVARALKRAHDEATGGVIPIPDELGAPRQANMKEDQ